MKNSTCIDTCHCDEITYCICKENKIFTILNEKLKKKSGNSNLLGITLEREDLEFLTEYESMQFNGLGNVFYISEGYGNPNDFIVCTNRKVTTKDCRCRLFG